MQDEDPTSFDQAIYEKKLKLLRKNDLGFFFYTRGLKLLSSSLKIFMQDMESFTKEILSQNLRLIEIQRLSMLESLHSLSSELSNEEYGFYEKQMEMLNVRTKWLTQMLSLSTIGSLRAEI
jgi:hypothetical protein